jgi:pimeloyl-ACP methyl ester carboxylesterase
LGVVGSTRIGRIAGHGPTREDVSQIWKHLGAVMRGAPRLAIAIGGIFAFVIGIADAKEPPVLPAGAMRLIEFTPWLVKNRGPDTAKGILYFIRGWSEGIGLDEFHLAPYLTKTLGEEGWDVIVAKYPQGNVEPRFRYTSVPTAAAFVRERVATLKAQGYKHIILAGQSWGSWVEMAADQQRGLAADALWLVVPNIYGPKTFDNGEKNRLFGLNYNNFASLLPAMRTPSVLSTFAEDRWEPGGRAQLLRENFERKRVPYLMIDQPAGFTGHFSGWLPIYDFAYGKCIQDFLEKPQTVACMPPRLVSDDFRSVFRLSEIANAEQKTVVSGSTLSGRTFVVFNLALPNKQYHYLYDYKSASQREIMSPLALSHEDVSFRNGQQCVGSVCSTLIKWSERELLEFDPRSGNLIAWWIER